MYWIRLTQPHDGQKILINAEAVISVSPTASGAALGTAYGTILVKESVADIYQLLPFNKLDLEQSP